MIDKIDCHKFSGLKYTKLCSSSSIDQKSDSGLTGLKTRCQQSSISFWRLHQTICSFAFSSFENLPSFVGSWPPSPCKASQGNLSPPHITSLWTVLCLLSLSQTFVIIVDSLKYYSRISLYWGQTTGNLCLCQIRYYIRSFLG